MLSYPPQQSKPNAYETAAAGRSGREAKRGAELAGGGRRLDLHPPATPRSMKTCKTGILLVCFWVPRMSRRDRNPEKCAPVLVWSAFAAQNTGKISARCSYFAHPICSAGGGYIRIVRFLGTFFWLLGTFLWSERKEVERRLPETCFRGPQFLGRQIFITESCYWLTGPIKTAKNAHNTGSCAWRELAAAAWVLPFRGENAGHAAPALRLSLRHSPLVNSAPQRRRSSVEGGSTYVVVGETW